MLAPWCKSRPSNNRVLLRVFKSCKNSSSVIKIWSGCLHTNNTCNHFTIRNDGSNHTVKYTTQAPLRSLPVTLRFHALLPPSSMPFSSMGTSVRNEIYFKETTLQLLCPQTFPAGSLDTQAWIEALEAIRFWTQQVKKSKGGLEAGFQLLDRLVIELDIAEDDEEDGKEGVDHVERPAITERREKNAILTKSLNLLIDAWRIAWNQQQTATTTASASAASLTTESEHTTTGTLPTPLEMVDRLIRYELRLQPLKPNIRTFNLILHAVANSKRGNLSSSNDYDPAIVAESMLEHLLRSAEQQQLQQQEEHDSTIENSFENGIWTDKPLRRRRKAWIQPDTVTFNTVIHAWAQSDHPDAPLKAEALLQQLKQYQKQLSNEDRDNDDPPPVLPNVITYNSVLTAWVNGASRSPYSSTDTSAISIPQRCEELMQEMENVQGLQPNRVTYFLLLKAWADTAKNDERGPERANNILQQLLESHDLNSNAHTPATSLSSSDVITSEDTTNHCDDLTTTVNNNPRDDNDLDLSDGDDDDKPESSHYPLSRYYTTVISAYASRGQATEAENLLNDLCRRYSETKDVDFAPDVTCFNAALDARAKQGPGEESAQPAESILQFMQRFGNIHPELRLKPNVISFSCVLHALARSKQKDAPQRCQELLDHMQQLYQKDLADCKPDLRAYHIVIDCWAKSDQGDAPDRCEALVRHLYKQYQSGNDPDLKPDIVCYNSVLNAWARSNRRSEAADQAQSLFDKIISTYEKSTRNSEGEPSLVPTLQTYTTLMAAWNRSNRPDGPAKAQAVYDGMVSRYEKGEAHLRPDTGVFNALLDAWAKAGNGGRAESLLIDMLERVARQEGVHISGMTGAAAAATPTNSMNGNVVIVPNARSFATVINAWSKSKEPNAAERAESVLRRFQKLSTPPDGLLAGRGEEYRPNNYCYNSALQAWAKSSDPKAVERAAALMAEMVEASQRETKSSVAGKSRGGVRGTSVAPNIYSYTFYLQAVDKCRIRNKAQHIRDVLDNIREQGIKMDATVSRLTEKYLHDGPQPLDAAAERARYPRPAGRASPDHRKR